MSGASGVGVQIPIKIGRELIIRAYLRILRPSKVYHSIADTTYRFGNGCDHVTVERKGILRRVLNISGFYNHINKLERLAGNRRLER
jgi:hypothetical protein